MWYEDGQLRPFLVRLIASISPFRGGRAKAPKREVPRSGERRHRVSVPGGSHQIEVVSALVSQIHVKGGITDNGKESQGREEEGRQETVS